MTDRENESVRDKEKLTTHTHTHIYTLLEAGINKTIAAKTSKPKWAGDIFYAASMPLGQHCISRCDTDQPG